MVTIMLQNGEAENQVETDTGKLSSQGGEQGYGAMNRGLCLEMDCVRIEFCGWFIQNMHEPLMSSSRVCR